MILKILMSISPTSSIIKQNTKVVLYKNKKKQKVLKLFSQTMSHKCTWRLRNLKCEQTNTHTMTDMMSGNNERKICESFSTIGL